MLQAINFSHLPQTFRDAMEVAQRLGIRYLWIDSLCIIQDSVEDWQKESATMSQVYSNGVVNICAVASRNSTEGIFYTRNTVCSRPVHMQVSFEGAVQKRTFCDADLWLEGVDEAPLNRRAWVMQERLLSKRNLCFGTE